MFISELRFKRKNGEEIHTHTHTIWIRPFTYNVKTIYYLKLDIKENTIVKNNNVYDNNCSLISLQYEIIDNHILFV